MRLLSAFRRCEQGASLAEFALVVPVFVGLMLAVINLSIAIYGLNDLHFAAQRTARCIAMKSASGAVGATDVSACLTQASSTYTGPAVGATFARTTAGCGNTVTGTGSLTIYTGLVNKPVSLSAAGCYPLQQ